MSMCGDERGPSLGAGAGSCPTALATTGDFDSVNCTLYGSYANGCWPKAGDIDDLSFARPAAQCYEVGSDGKTMTLAADQTACAKSADALPVYQLAGPAANGDPASPVSIPTDDCGAATASGTSCAFKDTAAGAACAYCASYAFGVGPWAAAKPSQ
jgi:hypothetical protein